MGEGRDGTLSDGDVAVTVLGENLARASDLVRRGIVALGGYQCFPRLLVRDTIVRWLFL